VSADADKTEPASPDKRQKARDQGDFPRAKDAGGVAAGLGALIALATMGPAAIKGLLAFAAQCFSEPFDIVHGDPGALMARLAAVLSAVALPAGIAAALSAMAIGFAQSGFHPQFELVMPNFGRLDPFGRLKGLFMPREALASLAQSLLRVGLVGYVVYIALRDTLPSIVRLARSDLHGAAGAIASALGKLSMNATIALALLAVGEYAWSKFSWEKSHRMSKQEIKDEYRRAEGDPRIKAQIRARARQRLKKGMVKQVRGSDVILANPTHVSVALRYRAKEGAPVVTAKGYDEIALSIREIALEAKIPIIENRVLARALAARVRVGKTIPVDLYAAVAEVLAFVYRMRGRRVA
jgi:flagellar biosynthetic protein FlhB